MGTGRASSPSKSQRTEGEQLMSCVSDTGVGLPREQADQIFNAFFTAPVTGFYTRALLRSAGFIPVVREPGA
jgi:hypothetical protein